MLSEIPLAFRPSGARRRKRRLSPKWALLFGRTPGWNGLNNRASAPKRAFCYQAAAPEHYTEILSRSWIILGLLVLYLLHLGGAGMLGPDEPRYASIGRAMAHSSDFITPRLNGEPWFEKPPLLYWMVAVGQWLHLSDEWAARLPIAFASRTAFRRTFLAPSAFVSEIRHSPKWSFMMQEL